MASNQTQHLNLCQWAENDEVLRADFNADNAKIDAAVAAVRSLAQAAYSPAQKPFVLGTYRGDGTSGRAVEVGFRPAAVLTVRGGDLFNTSNVGYNSYAEFVVDGGARRNLIIMDTGFTVSSTVNQENYTYNYIVWR